MIEPDRKEICAECGKAVLYGKQHLCGPNAEIFTFSDEVDWLPMPKEEIKP